MKNKILTLIIGILIGAIITSVCFVIYIKTNDTGRKIDFGTPPQMGEDQNFNQNGGMPPQFPNSEKTNINGENSTNIQNKK